MTKSCDPFNARIHLSQDKPLHASPRVIISNQTLVLQSITKASHGQYMCRATNLQGAVSSNDVYVDVKCKYCIVVPLGCPPNGSYRPQMAPGARQSPR